MASKSAISFLLLLSLFSTFTFAKKRWKLVKDKVEKIKEKNMAHDHKLDYEEDEQDEDGQDIPDGNDYRHSWNPPPINPPGSKRQKRQK